MTTTHDAATCPAAIFHGPREGPAIHMGSRPVVFKALSVWSGGAYEMHEQRLAPGVLVAPHTHTHQDQIHYVLSGTLCFLVGDQEFTAPAGSFTWRPRRVRQALWNAGTEESRFLEASSLGQEIEEFFNQFGDLTDAGAAKAEAIQALAAPYGISYGLALIPGLEARYGVKRRRGLVARMTAPRAKARQP